MSNPVPLADEKPTIAKAVVAAAAALGVALTTALADGQVTTWEIVLGLISTVGAAAAVWATSNDPAQPVQRA